MTYFCVIHACRGIFRKRLLLSTKRKQLLHLHHVYNINLQTTHTNSNLYQLSPTKQLHHGESKFGSRCYKHESLSTPHSTLTFLQSAPNANAPNEGIVGQIANSVSNAANYVSETIQGKSAETQKEADKEKAKGNVPGQDSISDRVSGALGAGQNKLEETKHDASAKANKEGI